jgi:hypothetical protein
MDKLAVVLVENRPILEDIWDRHRQFLPNKTKLYINQTVNSISDYNRLLTSFEFWEKIDEENILIIQHDSALLRSGIEEFYKWDYVGAPWTFQEHGGNGGLSFRKRSAMLRCLEIVAPFPELNEDVYFSNALKFLKMNLAPREICSKFSCETIFKLGTLGYHAIDKYLTTEQINQINNQYE